MGNIKVTDTHGVEELEMRVALCDTLIKLAKENENVVYLDSDLMSSMKTVNFRNEFPERTFNCGVQEANMMGTAAGLSAVGKVPFTHTFGPFATRRCFDQVFLSGGYSKQNIKIVGSDPGVTASKNGGTHMPFEDLGLMRIIPEMTIITLTDTTMLKNLIPKVANEYGMYYLRLLRKNAVQIYDEGSDFEIGKATLVKPGNDVTIIANGIMVNEAITAREMLLEEGIEVRIMDMFTLKPIDQEAIIKAAEETGAIVTCENHNYLNGLGSAVAEVLSENNPTPLKRIGVKDRFGQVGSVDFLKKEYELTAEDIVKRVKEVMDMK